MRKISIQVSFHAKEDHMLNEYDPLKPIKIQGNPINLLKTR